MVSKVRTLIGNEGCSEEVIIASIGKRKTRKEAADERRELAAERREIADKHGSGLADGTFSKKRGGNLLEKVGNVRNVTSRVKGKDFNVTKCKKHKNVHADDYVWDSGLKIVSPPILIDVPISIVHVMRAIDKSLKSSVEFSIYVKADISNIECITISEEYYVPKQSVSGASVDYEESPVDGFNAVIHKHPSGVMSFSGTDDEYINQNFTVSILWCGGKFVDATVNYDAGLGIKLQLDGYVYVDESCILPDVDVSKIHVGLLTPNVKLCGNGMKSFAEAYGYYSEDKFAEEIDYLCGRSDNGEESDVEFDEFDKDDDITGEIARRNRSCYGMLNCGME